MALLTRAVVRAVHTMALEILFYCVCVLGNPNASNQYLALAAEQQKGIPLSFCPTCLVLQARYLSRRKAEYSP